MSEGAHGAITLRAAVEGDVEAIVGLTAAGWRAAYRGIVPERLLEQLPVGAWRHDVSHGLRSPLADSFTRIAELEGEAGAAGYCFVAAPGREEPRGSTVAELVAIYVDPGHWRRGVGRALAAGAIEETARLGYTGLALWTFEANERARAFYRELGWRDDGARRPHQASGTPTIRMLREPAVVTMEPR